MPGNGCKIIQLKSRQNDGVILIKESRHHFIRISGLFLEKIVQTLEDALSK